MTEQKMPDRDRTSPEDTVSSQPDRGEKQQPRERASNPDHDRGLDEHEAARRQARQDPLQKRDR
jgi:hypothetical protein